MKSRIGKRIIHRRWIMAAGQASGLPWRTLARGRESGYAHGAQNPHILRAGKRLLFLDVGDDVMFPLA